MHGKGGVAPLLSVNRTPANLPSHPRHGARRGCTVTIEDQIHGDAPMNCRSSWLSACEPKAVNKDGWRWETVKGPVMVAVTGAAEIPCQPIPLDDPQLRAGWGPRLWQITISTPCSPQAAVAIPIHRPHQDADCFFGRDRLEENCEHQNPPD